ncbi:hypothetical protein O7627_27580 [Solwaraspora sp. WMMD1047]|uniref:hypothetical protein n=1 Tax=Solwaraspora sp. WMMD1047 TaxID=3016102 RepID=UPI002415ED09|nr:hypothetical protein [Solwaraspora sp. WMMD1047]MDG4833039.1 hypothetical protein [Solwaraspora sp. WMMD1047]
MLLVAVALGIIVGSYTWWSSRSGITAVGRPFDLNGVYETTVLQEPACGRDPEGEPHCLAFVEFRNVSGEEQHIDQRSFGTIGPKRVTFFYGLDPELDGQEYAVAAVMNGQYFKLTRATFERNELKAGEAARATLFFETHGGVPQLTEIQFAARDQSGRIYVRFS